MSRTLYVCQKCGDEVGEGEQDYRGRHPNCGGQLDPIGECPEDEEDGSTGGHSTNNGLHLSSYTASSVSVSEAK